MAKHHPKPPPPTIVAHQTTSNDLYYHPWHQLGRCWCRRAYFSQLLSTTPFTHASAVYQHCHRGVSYEPQHTVLSHKSIANIGNRHWMATFLCRLVARLFWGLRSIIFAFGAVNIPMQLVWWLLAIQSIPQSTRKDHNNRGGSRFMLSISRQRHLGCRGGRLFSIFGWQVY